MLFPNFLYCKIIYILTILLFFFAPVKNAHIVHHKAVGKHCGLELVNRSTVPYIAVARKPRVIVISVAVVKATVISVTLG